MTTVNETSAGRERVEVGMNGCGCPITSLMSVVDGELRGDVEGTERTEHDGGLRGRCWDDQRIDDADQAHDAAIVEYVNRNLVARGADPIDELPAHFRRMTLAEVEAGFAAYDALPAADDGPGRDQHGPHDGPVYVVDPREMVGLPAPDFPAVNARTIDELRTRVRRIIRTRDVGQYTCEDATEAILALLAPAGPRVSHEGATVSAALTAERFGPVGGDR